MFCNNTYHKNVYTLQNKFLKKRDTIHTIIGSLNYFALSTHTVHRVYRVSEIHF